MHTMKTYALVKWVIYLLLDFLQDPAVGTVIVIEA